MASENADPSEAVGVTALERRSRWLLRVYPADYRRERGEEMIGTLLEAIPAGLGWPRLRDVRGLAVGGLRARAALNRRLSMTANLRIAVMAGSSLYLVMHAAEILGWDMSELRLNLRPAWYWPGELVAALLVATVLLTWITPRAIAATSALAAAVAVYVVGQHNQLLPFVPLLVSLASLVLLAPRQGRPPRKWLWLIGAFAAAVLWFVVVPQYGLPEPIDVVRVVPVLAFGVVSIAWIAIDARLAVAVATFCLTLSAELWEGFSWFSLLPFLLIIAAVGTLAAWLLRRQSAPRGRQAR